MRSRSLTGKNVEAWPPLTKGPLDMNSPGLASNLESYVESHQAPGKGEAYDAYYAADPEMRCLWQQEQRVLLRILREFYSTQPAHLLDFACGTGRIAGCLENQVASSSAVDVSETMLAQARKKLARTRLLRINLLETCPFPKASFTLITAFRFFLNAEPSLRTAAVRALQPLLAEGGCFVFNIHQNSDSFYYRLTRFYCRMRNWGTVQTLSLAECERLLEPVGLRLCRVYPVGLLHIPKVRFSDQARQWVDGVGSRSNALGRLSDSPIVVARKGG
jgi:SAM-dependent methyltransferase